MRLVCWFCAVSVLGCCFLGCVCWLWCFVVFAGIGLLVCLCGLLGYDVRCGWLMVLVFVLFDVGLGLLICCYCCLIL